MVDLTGGSFAMGTDDADGFPADGEGPIREITLRPFRVDPAAVTNAQYAAFVRATGYVTDAERFGWSYVFHSFVGADADRQPGSLPQTPWWIPGAGRVLARPGGCRQRGRHPRQPPRRTRVVGRRDRVRPMGRRPAADRGGVGVRRPWRPRPGTLPVG